MGPQSSSNKNGCLQRRTLLSMGLVGRCWNIGRVHELYGQDLRDKICNLPIGEIGFGTHRFFWKASWKLDTIPKVQVFTWRVGHEILPTNFKIASIQRGFGQGCPRGQVEYETLIHALKDFPMSWAILSICGWNDSTILKDYKGKEDEAQVIWDRAITLSQDFCICNKMNEMFLSPNLAVKKWEKPPKGFVKINFDALVCDNRVRYGTIARDDDGFVLGDGEGFIEKSMTVEEVKCHTFEASIKIACLLNISGDVHFETDNAWLVNKLKNHAYHTIV
ncbi:hypothetical protein Gorai_006142 [Gossypium raimondii]|uniref:RNase H type-1 domain-containing protein n=1 Tax=Gossypium raimondii TaxID=29730 RepID=A0A7J8QFQ6_GOSRA|nr:hypothetical protein [Gossypium raimondii]